MSTLPGSSRAVQPHPTAPTATPLGRLTLAASLGVAALASLRELWAVDLGWQRAAGRWILAHGWPRGDALSWSVPGAPWIESRWLWCVTLATLWDHVGAWSVTLFSCALLTAAFVVAARTRATARSLPGSAALITLAVLVASQRLFARPEAVSYLLFATSLATLDADRRNPSRRVLALIPIQLLWVNAHSLFILGPALAALSAAASLAAARGAPGARSVAQRHALLALGMAAVSLLNPWGIGAYRQVLEFASQLHSGAAHALIPELAGAASFGLRYVATATASALAIVLFALLIRAPRRADLFLGLAALGGAAAGWASIRNLPLFALAAIPFGIALLPPTSGSRSWASRTGTAVVLTACMLLAWSLATDRFFVWQHDTGSTGFGVMPNRYAEQVAREVAALPARSGRPPRVWGTMPESSWLLTEGVASHFDPRIEPFGQARLAEHVAVLGGGAAWDALVARDRIEVAVLSLQSLPLLRSLAADSAHWRPVAIDAVAIAFVRQDAFTQEDAPALSPTTSAERIRVSLGEPPRSGVLAHVSSASPWHRTGNAFDALGRPDLAVPFLRAATVAEPSSTPARLSLATALERSGAAEAAFEERRTAFERSPRDPDAITQLSVELLVRGRLLEMAPSLEALLSSHPEHALAWALLGEARALQGRGSEAVRALERAVSLEPSSAQYRGRLEVIRRGTRP